MTQELPPAGWYPDPSGAPGQRYFDGADWTPDVQSGPTMAPMSDAQRTAILDQAVALRISQGGRVESRTQFQVVMVYGRPVNQVVHAILTIFTCFLWAIVWLLANGSNSGEHREVLQVDPYGNLNVISRGTESKYLPLPGSPS